MSRPVTSVANAHSPDYPRAPILAVIAASGPIAISVAVGRIAAIVPGTGIVIGRTIVWPRTITAPSRTRAETKVKALCARLSGQRQTARSNRKEYQCSFHRNVPVTEGIKRFNFSLFVSVA